MNLIDSLKKNFESVTASVTFQAPQNLLELRQQLRNACQTRQIHPDQAHYCNWYSDYLSQVHDREAKSMARTRGAARRMWAEQSLIYQDLIGLLAGLPDILGQQDWLALEEGVNELYELVDEFEDALKDMEDWVSSEDTRCLNCGWSGSTGHCPHCHLQTLKPVRDQATHVNHFVELAPNQLQLLHAITSVLEGRNDLICLRAPLQQLEQSYLETQAVLNGYGNLPLAQAGLQSLERGLAGIEQIRRAFQDHDAQHLEDGWSMIFHADRHNLELAATQAQPDAVAVAYEIIRDHVSMTNE